jgi:hypothetical protein
MLLILFTKQACRPLSLLILPYPFLLLSWQRYLVICTLILHVTDKLLVLFDILPSMGLICDMV